MKSLAVIVYETIHKAKKPGTSRDISIDELADLIGCSPSLLYKGADPNQTVDIKLSWLIPLMKATGNISILKHIAIRLGYVVVRVPRARKMKPEEFAAHQRTLADYQLALLSFINGEATADKVHEQVDKALEEVAGARKMVMAGDTKQKDLFEE